ncbi:hypothetical protein ACTXT7_017257 [Hymenolepis weldensis]
MWGSRIITKPNGPVTELKFDYAEGNVFGVMEDLQYKELEIEGSNCQVGSETIGSPCTKSDGTAVISFNEVENYKAFTILNSKKIPIVAAFMVPDCNFEETSEGKVDLKTSAPLSRFVKEQQEVELSFGVRPGVADFESKLYRNGEEVCTWMGKTVQKNTDNMCKHLESRTDNNLLVTRVTFPKKNQFAKDNYLWATPTSFLTVSVDWENEGVAPEVAECESEGVTLIPTTTVPTPAPIPSASESITLGTLAVFAIAKLF